MECIRPSIISINKIHTFFKADFKSDYSFKGEKHDWWEMVFVLSGSVGVTAESDVYALQGGQGIIHRPNEFHQIRSMPASNPAVIVISFSADSFPEPEGRIFDIELSEIEKLNELLKLSLECFSKDSIYITDITDSIKAQKFWLEAELFILSVLNTPASRPTEKSGKTSKSAELYSLAVKHMEKHPDATLCTDDIATEFSISSAYLKKIFHKYSGCGVMQYYNRLKARVACTYLDCGKSVKETAALLGFADQNNFSNFFKRVTGKSPTEYKNK